MEDLSWRPNDQERSPRRFMMRTVILVLFAGLLWVSGMGWIYIGFAAALIVLISQLSIAVQSSLERRTGRRPNPNSESYDATFFVVTLGISLPPIIFFPDLHPFIFAAITMTGTAIATLVAIVFFGKGEST